MEDVDAACQRVRLEERARAADIVRVMSRYGGPRAVERAESIAAAIVDADPTPEECASAIAELGIDVPDLAARLRKQVSEAPPTTPFFESVAELAAMRDGIPAERRDLSGGVTASVTVTGNAAPSDTDSGGRND